MPLAENELFGRISAVRGATTVPSDDAALVEEAVTEMLREILRVNSIASPDVLSVIFTLTHDLQAGLPDRALARAGLAGIPSVCAREIDVPGALQLCIRTLLHVHVAAGVHRLAPVYLRDAVVLRPDLAGGNDKTQRAR